MSFFDWFKRNPKEDYKKRYAKTMSGFAPVFQSFGQDIYASDIIVQSIRCIANEMMKLNPRHIRIVDGKQITVTDSSLAKCLRNPNEYQTTADFLSQATILRELNKNAFIYPDYYITNGGEKYYTGLYPLKPLVAEYVEEESTGELYIRFTFGNGYIVTLPQKDVIHWRKDYGVNDYFGGGMFGGDDERGLLKNLETYNTLTQSIAEALKCSLAVNGVMKKVSLISQDKLNEEREKFVADLRAGKSSILFLDNSAEYENIPRDIKLVDKDTMEFFYKTILYNSGVSLAILSGDYNAEQKAAFYESVLEAPIISLGQAITKVVFSDREQAFNNQVILYPDQIQNMSIDKRIAFMNVAVPAGALSKDEIRAAVGMPPIPDGSGSEYPRGYNNSDGGVMGTQSNNGGENDVTGNQE